MTTQPNTAAGDLSRLTVLVLEDQSFQRNLLVGSLEYLGIKTVHAVADGMEALTALDRNPDGFDVAICDLRMERMDGLEFIRHAANRKVSSFIVTSAVDGGLLKSAESVVRKYSGIHLVGVLPKPVDLEQLKAMLADCKSVKSKPASSADHPANYSIQADEIPEALAKGQFIPYFQPMLDLATGRPAGVELLARWNHPTYGILPPCVFIPHMERSGLIDKLSEDLLCHALEISRQWRSKDLQLAVNLSPLTLQNTEMPNHIGSLVRRYGADPGRITIEVTETAVSDDVSGLLESLTRLRMQGFSLSVDDFGTGYSTLLKLSEMPFTEIKIDRNFVQGATLSPKSSAIAESIVFLAKKLRLHTVAEGIETNDELEFVKRLGCETGQGYYFSRPLDHAQLLRFLDNPSQR